MAQLSRPFQIALLAVGLLAAVCVLALSRHSSSTSGSGSSAAVSSAVPPASTYAKATTAQSSSASAAAAERKAAAAPSAVYHGSAPGVEGLTRAIAKAHGAVASAQQNAKQLEAESAQASSATAPAASASTTALPASSSATSTASSTTAAATVHKAASAPGTASRSTLPSGQRAVEAELKQGKIVVLLFWNPKGADDVAVRQALQRFVAIQPDKHIAVHETSASQVTSFGSVTRAVQVYGTPTILIVNRSGRVTTLTGLTDAYAIEQAIDEARHS
jgi:hypothetical protein